jgi:phage baseplate assembly protein W
LEFNYPFQIDKNGKTAVVSDEAHVEQMIEQVLFTTPGERVNRPTFGSGINQLVFAPLRDELLAATQVLVQGALQQWLGTLITINSVQVSSQDSTLQVLVQYVIKKTQQAQVAQFSRTV